jgi:quinol monooxygenase YgiN
MDYDSGMILIRATIYLKANAAPDSTDKCVKFQRAARTEPGCLEYLFAADLEEPDRLQVLERWDTVEALDAHMGKDTSGVFGKWMNEMARSVSVTRYEVREDQSDVFRRHSADLMGDSVQAD